MKVAIVFEAPDEFSGASLTPEAFLRAYHERMFGIKIDSIVVPKQYRAEVQEPFKVGKPVKHLDPDPPQFTGEELRKYLEEFHAAAENIEREMLEQKELMKAVEEKRRYDPDEARDRRQQHKLAVKFSNRRK